MKKTMKLASAGLLVAATMLTAGCYGTATKQDCKANNAAADYGVVVDGKPYIVSGCDGALTPYDPNDTASINQVDGNVWASEPAPQQATTQTLKYTK